MKNMNLETMNLQALDIQDACEIDGGAWRVPIPSIVKKLTPAALALWVIDNWEDLKKGIYNGWNVN
jgi:hypothetical protein